MKTESASNYVLCIFNFVYTIFMPMVAFKYRRHIMQEQFCAIKKQITRN